MEIATEVRALIAFISAKSIVKGYIDFEMPSFEVD